MSRGVPDVLLQADLLIFMDVLLVILHTIDPLQLVLVILTQLKLVEGLA